MLARKLIEISMLGLIRMYFCKSGVLMNYFLQAMAQFVCVFVVMFDNKTPSQNIIEKGNSAVIYLRNQQMD